MTQIIPAIDIINGEAVRLEKGNYNKKTSYTTPLAAAQKWQQAGSELIHIVDLDGAKAGEPRNLKIISELINKLGIAVELGGGIRNDQHIKEAFAAGVARVIIGSLAVKDPQTVERWLQEYGSEKIVMGADVANGKIAISGWLEASELTLDQFIDTWQTKGAKIFLITDISRDGMLTGSNVDLYEQTQNKFPEVTVIASGGIGCQSDIDALKAKNIPYVVVGKALYEGKVSLS